MPNQTVTPPFPASGSGPSDPGGSPGAAEVAKSAAGKASEVAGSAVDNAKSVAVEASTQAKAVVSQAKDQVQSLAEQTKGELMTQADTKSQQAASGLRTLSDQLSALSEGRPGEAGQLTHLVREAESRVSALASRIEQGGPQGVLDDVTAYARRRPGMFLVGAIGAGFLAGRIVRSGTAAASEQSDQAAPDQSQGRTQSASTTPGIGYPTASLATPALNAPLMSGDPLMTPPVAPDPFESLDGLR
jgi:hypothetical protein